MLLFGKPQKFIPLLRISNLTKSGLLLVEAVPKAFPFDIIENRAMNNAILLFFLSMVCGLCAASRTSQQPSTTPSRQQFFLRTLGTATFSLNSQQCFSYTAFLLDEFFNDLHGIQTEHGVEFRKGQKVVTFFPAHFTVRIHAIAYSCKADQSLAAMGLAGAGGVGNPAMMFGLRFKANWEDAGRSKPIGRITVREIPPPAWHEYGSDYFGRYEVKISANNMPLTNTLVLCVSSKEVKPQVCIRGRLQ